MQETFTEFIPSRTLNDGPPGKCFGEQQIGLLQITVCVTH